MAADFLYTNPEAARQAIARMQLEAAAAENQSRERIEKDRTQAAKYATQSQIAAADKDRDVRKEDLALRRDIISANAKLDNDATRDSATKARAKLQFSSIVESLNNNTADPPTAKELETLIAGAPDLTEDHRTAARNLRADIVKLAKSNAAAGERAAKNYQAELKGKGITGKGLDLAEQAKVYERMAKDPNIIFDRATGSVTSAFRQPREDTSPTQSSLLGATRPGGIFPSASEMQAAGRPSGGGVPIGKFLSQVGRPVAGPAFAEAADLGAPPEPAIHQPTMGGARMADAASMAPPTQAEILGVLNQFPGAIPGGSIGLARVPQGGRMGQANIVANPMSALSGFSSNVTAAIPHQRADSIAFLQNIRDQADSLLARMPRMADIAQPAPVYGPQEDYWPPARANMPLRVGDFQTLRPEYVPIDDSYYAPR